MNYYAIGRVKRENAVNVILCVTRAQQKYFESLAPFKPTESERAKFRRWYRNSEQKGLTKKFYLY